MSFECLPATCDLLQGQQGIPGNTEKYSREYAVALRQSRGEEVHAHNNDDNQNAAPSTPKSHLHDNLILGFTAVNLSARAVAPTCDESSAQVFRHEECTHRNCKSTPSGDISRKHAKLIVNSTKRGTQTTSHTRFANQPLPRIRTMLPLRPDLHTGHPETQNILGRLHSR